MINALCDAKSINQMLRFKLHCVSKKTSPFLFLWYLCQISSDFAHFWQKHTSGNLKQTHIHGPIYIPFYIFILYLVKTSDAWERTLQRRPVLVRLVIKPESCNFFKRLFKPLTFQPLSENSWTNFLAPKTLNLYKFFTKCDFSGAWLLHDLVWSASACHRRGNRPCGVDGCAPVWELMDETSNSCSDNMNVTW